MSKRKIQPLTSGEKELLKMLNCGESLDDMVKPLMKRLIEASLGGELDEHLLNNADSGKANRRNGYGSKRLKSGVGEIEIATPRDRNSSFEPTIIAKGQTAISEGICDKILSFYKSGMSYSDIQESLKDLYDTEISVGTISKITDRILDELDEFKNRPLDEVYPIIYMDAIHFKVRDKDDGIVKSRAIYTLLAVNKYGKKEILGMYSSESEGAAHWSSVLADLKARGIKDILIASIDNLSGFKEAIEAHFPNCNVQLCIVHQIRNSLKYITSKDQKEFLSDLKKVYKASNRDNAESELLKLDEKWGKTYHVVLKSWHNNWESLSKYFDFSPMIRKLIYTTNPVEGVHRQIRKYTKSKAAFTSQKALEKLVFCAFEKATKKWTQPIQNWALIISELDLTFKNRLKLDIN